MFPPSGRSHSSFVGIPALAALFLAALLLAGSADAALRRDVGALQERTPDAGRRAAGIASAGDLELDLLRQLNVLRARYRMRPLRRSPALAAAARFHSRAMAQGGFFGHSSADGTPFNMRVERFYLRPRWWREYVVGENLVRGSHDLAASTVLRLWLSSPPHRRNLLGKWREVGFGAVRATGAPGAFGGERVAIVTADFGMRR
ncbi:MAG: CAP domain-containing protein [Gaiellaceae bacterium]